MLPAAKALADTGAERDSAAYLLDNGMQYHIAHAAGIAEYVLEEAYLPAEWRKLKHLGGVIFLGKCHAQPTF